MDAFSAQGQRPETRELDSLKMNLQLLALGNQEKEFLSILFPEGGSANKSWRARGWEEEEDHFCALLTPASILPPKAQAPISFCGQGFKTQHTGMNCSTLHAGRGGNSCTPKS